jgi:hypothetical protein
MREKGTRRKAESDSFFRLLEYQLYTRIALTTSP